MRRIEPDPGSGGLDLAIVVHDHATPALISGVGSLDDPASGQDDEASDEFLPKRPLRVAQGAGRAVAGPRPDAMGLLNRPSTLAAVRTIERCLK